MDINEIISYENERHSKTMETINRCIGLEEYIVNVSNTTIFCKTVSTFDEFKNQLKAFSAKYGKYKTGRYYLNSEHVIAVIYVFNCGFDLALYCYDITTTLNSVGNGKCRVVTNNSEKSSIVCDMEAI